MDFEALGGIGELLGAIAVVVSLIYVAGQIRQNTKTTSIANHQNALSLYSTFTDWTVRDPELARLLRNGLHGFDSLSPDDRFRFSQMMMYLFLFYNYQRESHESGFLDEGLFSIWEAAVASLLKMPGGASWWAGAKGVFLPAARERIEEAIAATSRMDEVWPSVWAAQPIDDHQPHESGRPAG